jgi:hypothetical protein
MVIASKDGSQVDVDVAAKIRKDILILVITFIIMLSIGYEGWSVMRDQANFNI